MRKKISLLCLLILFTALLSVNVLAEKKVVVANIASEPRTIDPAINNSADGSTVIFNIFEGLARINLDNDKPEAGIAKSWDVSEDGKKYTFHLRDNLKWSDGSELNAEDVKYGIMRVINPETASSYAYHAYSIKNAKAYYEGKMKKEDVGVTVVDENTLEIELEYPIPFFMDIISWHLLLPLKEKVVAANPQGWSQDTETIISNGPFRVKEWKHNEYILLEKNPYYWDKENVKIDQVKLVMITDGNTALTAYRTDKIDYMSNIPPIQVPQLLKSGQAQVIDQLGPYFYIFNVDKEPFDNAKVRKALSAAINRQALVQVITRGGQKPATGFLPYGIPGEDPKKDFRSEVEPYINVNGNIEEAKKLMKEAGYPGGKGFPEVTLLYNTSENHKAVAEAIQAMWKKNLGIDVGLSNQEWKVFINTRKQGDYDIARHGYFSDFNDLGSLFDLWISDSPNNDAQYNSPEYDKLVLAAREEQDPVKRASLYHQAEDILMADMPVMPIYYYSTSYLLKDHVKGMHVSPLGWEFYREVYLEE